MPGRPSARLSVPATAQLQDGDLIQILPSPRATGASGPGKQGQGERQARAACERGSRRREASRRHQKIYEAAVEIGSTTLLSATSSDRRTRSEAAVCRDIRHPTVSVCGPYVQTEPITGGGGARGRRQSCRTHAGAHGWHPAAFGQDG